MNESEMNDIETIEPTVNNSRRRFLISSGGVAAAAAVLAACSDDEGSSTDTTAPGEESSSSPSETSESSSGEEPAGDDLAVAKVAAGLEALAVAAYTMVGDRFAKRKTGSVFSGVNTVGVTIDQLLSKERAQ